MIELKNVFVAYNREYFALYDISLTLKSGDSVALSGDKGSGRTALLRVIAGLENIKKGEIYFDNTPLNRINFERDISLGYISTPPVFFENKTVYKNLEYVLKIRGIDKNLWKKQIDDVLKKFGIKSLENEKVGTLCGSDRRIVQFARLSLRKLNVLLCDDLEIEEDEKIFAKVIKSLKILLEVSEPEIFVIACTDASKYKDITNKTIKINSGSIEGKKGDK